MTAVRTSEAPPVRRRKRLHEEARREALDEARRLLLSGGPDAVTLMAVGKAMGMTHGNVIHHFGSAAGLQSALMADMVRELASALQDVVSRVRCDPGAPRVLVDIVFDAFDRGGVGKLAAWIALAGDLDQLEPVRQAVAELIQAIKDALNDHDDATHDRITSAISLIAASAIGDAIIGAPLRAMLGGSDDAGREIAARLLPSFFPQRP